jgi:hypothetical protein
MVCFSTQLTYIIGIFVIICFTSAQVIGDSNADIQTKGTIILNFVDVHEKYSIERVSLMKKGEYYKDGRVPQYQDISFNRINNQVIWNPCNDNECTCYSFPSSGGNNGRDQLVLEFFLINHNVDTSSCSGNPTCKRLRGGTRTISGLINGIFSTGKTYDISVSGIQPGVGESFKVSESR